MLRSILTISMASYNAGLRHLAVPTALSSLYIAHHSLFSGAHGAIVAERRYISFTVETTDLQLSELDVEVRNEVFKDVATLGHQFRRLLISQYLLNVLIGSLEVGEQQNEDLFRIPRDLDQIDDIVDQVEVSVQDLTSHVDAVLVEADVHGRGSLLGDDVDFVRAAAVKFARWGSL